MAQTADMLIGLAGSPLSAGAGALPGSFLAPDEIYRIADAAAQRAISSYRERDRFGRDDRGTGSVEIGNILRHRRERAKMTQRQLADAAGLHPTTIGKIETGERGMSLATFCKLAQVFGTGGFIWKIIDQLAPNDD